MRNHTFKTDTCIFRVPEDASDQLEKLVKRTNIVGIRSKNQFARKLVLDFLSGRLIYTDPSAAGDNPLLTGASTAKS